VSRWAGREVDGWAEGKRIAVKLYHMRLPDAYGVLPTCLSAHLPIRPLPKQCALPELE